jgi:hypothetical protein
VNWTYHENEFFVWVEDDDGPVVTYTKTDRTIRTAKTIALCPTMVGFVRDSIPNLQAVGLKEQARTILKSLEG